MGLLRQLAEGKPGVRFACPARYELLRESDDFAMLADRERRVGLTLHLADLALDTRPELDALWREDVAVHARELFDRSFPGLERVVGVKPPERPRTADPTWSPTISTGRVRVGEVDALTVIHRLSFEPCHERVLGHLLIPLGRAMFEFRVMQTTNRTGSRVAGLVDRALGAARGKDPRAVMARLDQPYFDDSAHDGMFPADPLSLVRAELQWLIEEAGITVEPRPVRHGEVVMSGPGLAVTPPPRYALCLADDDLVQFTRVSYACTEGQRTLTVGCLPDLRLVPRPGRADALRGTAAQRMAAMAPNDPNGRITVGDPAGTARDTHVNAYLQYRGFDGRHTAYRWIARADGAVLFIAVNGVDCLPREALFADVETVAASLRPLDDKPAPARSWWRFW